MVLLGSQLARTLGHINLYDIFRAELKSILHWASQVSQYLLNLNSPSPSTLRPPFFATPLSPRIDREGTLDGIHWTWFGGCEERSQGHGIHTLSWIDRIQIDCCGI